MPKIQIKRGSKANLPTLSDGEMALCKDTSEIFIGNGSSKNQIITSEQEVVNLKQLTLNKNGNVLKLNSEIDNGHCYIEYYTNGINKARSGYVGYASSGDTNFLINNEIGDNSINAKTTNTICSREGEEPLVISSNAEGSKIKIKTVGDNKQATIGYSTGSNDLDIRTNVGKINFYTPSGAIKINDNRNVILEDNHALGDKIDFYVSLTGEDKIGNGFNIGTPFKTIQYAIDLIPKNINATYVIHVADGYYKNMQVNIVGFNGTGLITIQSDRTITNPNSDVQAIFTDDSYIKTYMCNCRLGFAGLGFITTRNDAMHINSCQYASVLNCWFTGRNGVLNGEGWSSLLYFSDVSHGVVGSCYFKEFKYKEWMCGALTVAGNSDVRSWSNTITGNSVGVLIEYSTLRVCHELFSNNVTDKVVRYGGWYAYTP